MARNSRVFKALLVLGMVCLIPAGAFAGPPSSGPYYSPCHYWTPLLYRCYAKCYYGVCGHQYTLDYYPSGPAGEQILSHPDTTVEPGTSPSAANQPSPARYPETGDR
jgi:hypothetical protein